VDQLHKRFTTDQVKAMLQGYCRGSLDRSSLQEVLGVSKTRFFALLKQFRANPDDFAISYLRTTKSRLPSSSEEEIKKELVREKQLIDDPSLPITSYNYSAIKDRLEKGELRVSLPTIIDRAKALGCCKHHPQGKAHDRQVITTAIGALIQHDASHHRWSPYAEQSWALITSIDDFSRKLLYAEFVEEETTWAHIKAAEAVVQAYGLPLRYYVDSLRVFRFVQGRDSVWRKHVLQTDEAEPQWRRMMRVLGVDVTYALSPQAKGKIERPYRWLQDRIVRTCALEKLSTIDEARTVLREEVTRYNDRQVHSTTGEIPNIRFDKARKEANTLFRPFAIPKPYTSRKDLFCLIEKRTTDGYGKVSFFGQQIHVPHVPLREEVDIHLVPNPSKQAIEIRIWWNNRLSCAVTYPLNQFPRVHF